jgi:hypothetical protein
LLQCHRLNVKTLANPRDNNTPIAALHQSRKWW